MLDLEQRAALLAQEDVTAELIWERSPEPFKERYRQLATIHPRLSYLPLIKVAATNYRTAEQDGTPRMWRGKQLQDLANNLDVALEVLVRERELHR